MYSNLLINVCNIIVVCIVISCVAGMHSFVVLIVLVFHQHCVSVSVSQDANN